MEQYEMDMRLERIENDKRLVARFSGTEKTRKVYRVRFGPFGCMTAYVTQESLSRENPTNPLIEILKPLLVPYITLVNETALVPVEAYV